MARFLCAAALLALAACTNAAPDAAPDAAPETRALEGCASGRTATLLHQNFPGGTDFSATRCAGEGY